MSDRTCEKCGAAIPWLGTGRPPKYCHAHRRNRKRDAAKIVEHVSRSASPINHQTDFEKERRSALHALKRDGAKNAEVAAKANRARRLALGLALEKDAKLAALSVGLEVEPAELATLEKDAIERHAELIKLDTAAIGRLLLASIGQAAVRLFETVSTVAPSQLPGAIKSAAQALELLQGGTDPVMSDLTMVFQLGPEGEKWNPNTLLPVQLRTSAKPPKTGEPLSTPANTK